MEKRYQIFLSSTYEDLKGERLEVLKAILELDHIPCGMEYFPAAGEEQWNYIKDLINQCDYYVVVIAGRYGSVDETGMGFTEREYDYALEKGIPAISFIHGDPSSLAAKNVEKNKEGQKRLERFRSKLKKRLCKEWLTPQELGAVVSRSLTQLIRRNLRTGWVRADTLTETASSEILRLERKVQQLESELAVLRIMPPAGSEQLAQGSDIFTIEYQSTIRDTTKEWREPERTAPISGEVVATWDDIFSSFAPDLIPPIKESAISAGVGRLCRSIELPKLKQDYPNHEALSFRVSPSTLRRIKMQFTALGYVEFFNTEIEGKNTRFVKLTRLGEKKALQISTIKRPT
jgi:hypothetical protein